MVTNKSRFSWTVQKKEGCDNYAVVNNCTQRICKFYLQRNSLIFWEGGIIFTNEKQNGDLCIHFVSLLWQNPFFLLNHWVGTYLYRTRVPFANPPYFSSDLLTVQYSWHASGVLFCLRNPPKLGMYPWTVYEMVFQCSYGTLQYRHKFSIKSKPTILMHLTKEDVD